MKHPDWTVERAEIERIAREYQDQGYDVIVEPGPAELPDFIRGYRPDLIVRGPEGCIVVQVKQHRSDTEPDRIRAIAHLVQNQPGWRFVFVSPQYHSEALAESAFHRPEDKDVRRLAEEARALVGQGHPVAALLLAWAALEGGMRVAASREGVNIRRPDTWSLMRELVSIGLINREQFSQLSDVFKLRSALAHGLQAGNTEHVPEAIDLAVSVTAELLAEHSETH